MCTGRIDLAFIARAFLNEADGVFIAGCRLNECSYITHGNYYALNMTILFKRILEYFGLSPERIHIDFMTSSDAQHFAERVNIFTEKIRNLGPLSEEVRIGDKELRERFSHLLTLVPYIKIAKREKFLTKVSNPEEWNNLFTLEEIQSLFEDIPSYWIDPERCVACTLCAQRCPVDAIDGGKNKIHIINQETCIKCGNCFSVCPEKFSAVKKLVREAVPSPITEERRTILRT